MVCLRQARKDEGDIKRNVEFGEQLGSNQEACSGSERGNTAKKKTKIEGR